MAKIPIGLVDDAATARIALSPLRRELLAQLAEPASAAGLSAALGLPRQKISYHLKVLEEAGLIVVTAERQRRGFVERLFVARPDRLVIDPMILSTASPDAVEKEDRHAAQHLVRSAAGIVREVSRMREEAEREGSRLLTFTIEADIGFAAPADLDRFTERLSQAIADLARDYAPEPGTRIYRIVAAGHPAVAGKGVSQSIN